MSSLAQLDVLAVAAHPDDVELGCGATLAKLAGQGYRVGILDLTEGELGTRGSVQLRQQEAADAAQLLGVSYRANARLRDGFFANDEAHQRVVISHIRHIRPRLMLINAPEDRHPDHGRAHALVHDSAFLAGLARIETQWEGIPQAPWRPSAVYAYIQDRYLAPSFVIPVSAQDVEAKMLAIKAYRSQFYDPTSSEPDTYISRPDFLHWTEARLRAMGHLVGQPFGEGFLATGPLAIDNPLQLAFT